MTAENKRPQRHSLEGLDRGKSMYYADEADALLEKLEAENQRLRSALERLLNNAQHIFLKHPVRDWAETLAEAGSALKERI